MLHHLSVEHMGVIASASLELSPGFTVITGETGAGKTLLLGGLLLLTGERADSGVVASGAEQARADALFEHHGTDLAVTRLVPAQGKSRAYLEGVLVSTGLLVERVSPLVEIIRQHDQLSLRRPGYVLALVDGKGDNEHHGLLDTYRAGWAELTRLRGDLVTLGGDQMTLRRELDLQRHQAAEVAGAALEPEEDDRLESEASRLRNVEEIATHLSETLRLLERMNEDGGELVARTRKIAGLDPGSGAISDSAEEMVQAGHELTRTIGRLVDQLEADPGRLDLVEQRLNLIGDLKRKYGRTLDEVIGFGQRADERADEIERLLGRVDGIETEVARMEIRVAETGAALSESRMTIARALEADAISHLRDLGMDSPALEVRVGATEAGAGGCDRAEIWFTSDARIPLARVGQSASGGELSRLVLAVRLAAQSRSDATLVFDEVDTGVGGVTALALGRKIAELARSAQVVCVTHLPQVAAYADTHYVVSRTGPGAAVVSVQGQARVVEISRMLAGLPKSEAGQGAAEELLALAANR